MYPHSYFAQGQVRRQPRKCFVIMPFRPEMDEIYQVVRETLEAPRHGFECSRASDFMSGRHVMEDILRGIGEAEVVIADLTGANPNVFYELGIAHTVREPDTVLMLTQDIATVPFDLRPFRCIEYTQSIRGARELSSKLSSAIEEIAEHCILVEITEGGTSELHEKLFGEENCLYSFHFHADHVGHKAAKLRIQATRHAIGAPPRETTRGYGMVVGDAVQLPHVPWSLVLIGVEGKSARFAVSGRNPEAREP
jgi:hypothetical protein